MAKSVFQNIRLHLKNAFDRINSQAYAELFGLAEKITKLAYQFAPWTLFIFLSSFKGAISKGITDGRKRKDMTVKHLLILITMTCCFTGCVDDTRQQQLEQREQILARKEMEFAERAAEYQSLLQMRDSLRTKKSDTVVIKTWPQSIGGSWIGKTFCRESNCTDYVVGDQRSDTWAFENDSTSIFTKIINKDKLLRIYNAEMDSTEIRLHYKSDSTATRKVDIRVVLTASDGNVIKGTQTISVNNSCTAKFSVELVKNPNQ